MAFDAQFISISAVLGGVKDIRDAVQQAEAARDGLVPQRTIVFVDEVHRFNKSQQDAFLPHVESGLFTFIGATTENPSFEVNSALLSRGGLCAATAAADDLKKLWPGPGPASATSYRSEALERLIAYADGDARRLLNTLETLPSPPSRRRWKPSPTPWLLRCWASACAAMTKAASSSTTPSARCTSRCAAPTPTPRCTGWCACSMAAPTRATWRGASCAWPGRTSAWPTRAPCRSPMQAAQTYERLGPRGRAGAGQAVLYLAVAPKSNAGYMAYNKGAHLCEAKTHPPGALHLRNAPTRLMKELDYGKATATRTMREGGFAAGEKLPAEGMEPPASTARGCGAGDQDRQKLDELRARNAAARAGE